MPGTKDCWPAVADPGWFSSSVPLTFVDPPTELTLTPAVNPSKFLAYANAPLEKVMAAKIPEVTMIFFIELDSFLKWL